MVARFDCEHPEGVACQWRDYKAIATDLGTVANYQNNPQLIDWVNQQLLANPLTCRGVWA